MIMDNNKNKKRKFGVYLDSMINKILYCGFSFIANMLLTRYLGTELKGDYTYILNMASMIAILAGAGIYHSIPYFNRQNNDPHKTLLEYTNIFVFQCILYAVICTVIGVLTPGDNLKFIMVLTVLDNVTQQLNMLMLVKDVKKRNRIFLLGAILNVIFDGIAFICLEKSVMVAVIIMVAVKIYYLAAYLITIREPISFKVLNRENIIKYIRFGYLPMLSFLLITMNYKMDVAMLKWAPQVSEVQLSYYSLGVTVADIAWVISDVFKDVIFSKTAKGNHYKEVTAALRVSNVLMLLVVFGMVLFGKPFIHIFYGAEFVPSYDITVMLFFGVPLMSWFKILHPLFNAQGKRWFPFITLLITVIVNIGLNAALIPNWGIQGAAFASIVSYAVCGLIYLVNFSRVSQVAFWKLFIPNKQDFLLILKAK